MISDGYRYVLLLLCFFVATSTSSFAQFFDVSASHNISNVNDGTIYGNGVSFYDFNNDGWDDLTLGSGNQIPLFYENIEGEYSQVFFDIPVAPVGNVEIILWADYDNDGDPDLLTSQFGGFLQLWNNDGYFNFTEVSEAAGLDTGFWAWWGASFCDYNHDGYLDLYAGKYYDTLNNFDTEKQGLLYLNNGDGTFTDVTTAAGVELLPQPIFQPVWFDYNHDGWEDLYLIIDRIVWENRLFKNNGDGTFTDVSQSSGTDVSVNSMTGTIGDYDNDQDFDIYVTNGPSINYLFRNNNDETFDIVTEEAGLLVDLTSWGALWLDYDNNGWEDIFVGTTGFMWGANQNKFYTNNEDGTFTDATSLVGLYGDLSPSFVSAIGDINNDGYYDFVTNNNDPFPTILWQNDGGANHFLSATLKGTTSNKEGIGSWITCYADNKILSRYTHCGENIVGQSSRKEIFGLAGSTSVDSLRIEWNSGTIDTYYNLDVDQHLFFVEGESFCVGTPCRCAGDLSGDGYISTSDLLLFLSAFGCTTDCAVDFNEDDQTTVADLLIFLSFNFSLCN
jgi:hypothetical protein